MIYAFINNNRPYIGAPEFAEEVAKMFPIELQANTAEECCEFAQIVLKLIRGKENGRNDLIEEMADVLIMIQYMIAQQNVSDDELIQALEKKLKRATERYQKTGNPFLTSSQVKKVEMEKEVRAKLEKESKEKEAKKASKKAKTKETTTNTEKKEKKSRAKKAKPNEEKEKKFGGKSALQEEEAKAMPEEDAFTSLDDKKPTRKRNPKEEK